MRAVASVVQRCVKGGAEVVAFLKTGSAYYAPGASIAKMVEAILTDSHEVMSVCAHIDGQYGIEDLYMNVPVRLGKNGVEEVVEFDLNDDELAALRASADSVRAGLANCRSSRSARRGREPRRTSRTRSDCCRTGLLLSLPVERVGVDCDSADRGSVAWAALPVVKGGVALPLGRKGSACWSRSTRGTASGAGAAWTIAWARILRWRASRRA